MKDFRLPGIGLHQFPRPLRSRAFSTFVNNAKERLKAEPKGKLAAAGTVGAIAGVAIAIGWVFLSPRKTPS